MKISFLALGWRSLGRDLRAGELRLLMVAVTLAVAALTAVGFFADRLKGGLARDARQLLGGDAVLVSDNPIPEALLAQAKKLGLAQVQTLSFPTMARAPDALGGNSKLVALKAVAPGYPLRGQLQVSDQLDTAGAAARDIPKPGEAWVDAPILDAPLPEVLNLPLGGQLLLGDASFKLTRIILNEPDRGAGFMSFSPRVMVNSEDIPATGLIQPASRVRYQLAVAGDDQPVRAFVEAAQAQIANHVLRGARVDSLEGGRPELNTTLTRAEKFLNLVALLAALLSAVAVALAARGFAASHLDDCAMLRVLGLRQRTIAAAYTFEFTLIGLLASAFGVLLGFLVHYGFVALLAGLVNASLPPAGVWPVLFGMGMGLTLLLAFVGVAGFAALLLAASSDIKLGLIAVGGFAVATLLFAGLSWLAVKLLRATVNDSTAPTALVLATRQIAARPAFAVVQVSSLAVGLLALVLLVLLRTDLIGSWRAATPANAPNRFVINIMPEQGDAFTSTLKAAGVASFDWFPMIRGRLIAINGRDVSPGDYTEERASRLVDREFNLSHSDKLPEQNKVVSGRWQNDEAGAVSVEEGIAKTLGLSLGDTLTFDVGGARSTSKITSLRKVDWGSMRANFFVMYPVAKLDGVPATYMSAFQAPATKGFDNALVRAFPNITTVDMTATIGQIQRVLDLVLFPAITATREERAREYAIMRAVGARASLLRRVQRIELAGVGLLAGFLASVVASAVGWALARYVFEFDWVVSLWVPLLGALAGAVLALMGGWWGLREVLNRRWCKPCAARRSSR